MDASLQICSLCNNNVPQKNFILHTIACKRFQQKHESFKLIDDRLEHDKKVPQSVPPRTSVNFGDIVKEVEEAFSEEINLLNNHAPMSLSNLALMSPSNLAPMSSSSGALMSSSNVALMSSSNLAPMSPSNLALMSPSNLAPMSSSNDAPMSSSNHNTLPSYSYPLPSNSVLSKRPNLDDPVSDFDETGLWECAMCTRVNTSQFIQCQTCGLFAIDELNNLDPVDPVDQANVSKPKPQETICLNEWK
jgi:hypothetical protein